MHSKLFLTKAAAAAASVIHSNSSAISLEKPMSSGIHSKKTQKECDMVNRQVNLGVLHNQFNNINDSSSNSLLFVDRSKVEFSHTVATFNLTTREGNFRYRNGRLFCMKSR
jgi:hypothetical protein